MADSKEVRLLQNKWLAGTGWPKRLDALEIQGIRGWTGQRIEFHFPLVAIVGGERRRKEHRFTVFGVHISKQWIKPAALRV